SSSARTTITSAAATSARTTTRRVPSRCSRSHRRSASAAHRIARSRSSRSVARSSAGSAHFAAHPPAALQLERVVYDINLDMVGSYAQAGAVHAMGTFRGLAATPIVRALAAERPALHVGIGGRGAGSDHEPFCRVGIPYVFFWTPDRRCYHQRCDTVERLDAEHLAAIAALAADLVDRLANST